MAAINGQAGSVKTGANTIANMGDWSLTLDADVADITTFGATGSWRQKLPTVKQWSAKFTGRFDSADTNGQVVLINGLGTSVALDFNVDGTHKWSGAAAIITSIAPKSTATGVVEVDFGVTGNGALTYS